MKKGLMMMGVATMIAGTAAVPDVARAIAQAQATTGAPATRRINLQRRDLSVPGREVIQVRVEFDPGYAAPRHTHFGEEIIYVIAGELEYTVEGQPTKTYKPGEVLTVPYGAVHSVKNVGRTNGAELATYVVEKGKPLITLVK